MIKLKFLDKWLQSRRKNALFYRDHLSDSVKVPKDEPAEFAVYHTFMIQAERRNELKHFLKAHGIETKIHYPIPIHLQEAYQDLELSRGSFPITERYVNEILSLPMYPELNQAQIEIVIDAIDSFVREKNRR